MPVDDILFESDQLTVRQATVFVAVLNKMTVLFQLETHPLSRHIFYD